MFSEAFAQSNIMSKDSFGMSFIPLILIFIIFYFLLIRPQQKKAKETAEMIKNLKIKDRVITSGGIIGVVKKINENEEMIDIEIAEGVVIKVLKDMIINVLNKEIEKK